MHHARRRDQAPSRVLTVVVAARPSKAMAQPGCIRQRHHGAICPRPPLSAIHDLAPAYPGQHLGPAGSASLALGGNPESPYGRRVRLSTADRVQLEILVTAPRVKNLNYVMQPTE
jgi:hypothetical protein